MLALSKIVRILRLDPNTFQRRAVASGETSGARPPHLKSVPPHFTFGHLVAANIQYSIFKMFPPPFWFLVPPAVSWRRACFNGSARFSIMKDPHKLDLNYVFLKYVADRKFPNCYLERKLSFQRMDRSKSVHDFIIALFRSILKLVPKRLNFQKISIFQQRRWLAFWKIKKKISHFLLSEHTRLHSMVSGNVNSLTNQWAQ